MRPTPMDTARTAMLLAIPKPILFSKKFQGLGCLCRKDNSSQGSDTFTMTPPHNVHIQTTTPCYHQTTTPYLPTNHHTTFTSKPPHHGYHQTTTPHLPSTHKTMYTKPLQYISNATTQYVSNHHTMCNKLHHHHIEITDSAE